MIQKQGNRKREQQFQANGDPGEPGGLKRVLPEALIIQQANPIGSAIGNGSQAGEN